MCDISLFSLQRRYFVEKRGIAVLVTQSYSKNFGLYGERIGALNVVCRDSTQVWSLLMYHRSLLMYRRSLLMYRRSLLMYRRSLLIYSRSLLFMFRRSLCVYRTRIVALHVVCRDSTQEIDLFSSIVGLFSWTVGLFACTIGLF